MRAHRSPLASPRAGQTCALHARDTHPTRGVRAGPARGDTERRSSRAWQPLMPALARFPLSSKNDAESLAPTGIRSRSFSLTCRCTRTGSLPSPLRSDSSHRSMIHQQNCGVAQRCPLQPYRPASLFRCRPHSATRGSSRGCPSQSVRKTCLARKLSQNLRCLGSLVTIYSCHSVSS
jgi:hypothetical protein